ncbi:hypothetical protein RJ639_016073 [Escallonia herrerae]|uniref:CCHC-type domain-containing protein n=1 Tax=Escallonia herrerae TaxID=1293975 RepID=A0AA89AJ67_9ASTE|nr:hypothetical protein RJ639_016073 [Escallonia herrerae]
MARGRSTDHAGSKNNKRSRSQSKAKKLKCYYCHNEGHYRKDCPERKGKKKDNSKTTDAGVVEDNFDGVDVLLVTISSSDGGWILDTDYVGDLDRRRSLTGYVFTFSSCVISWKATLQIIVALSITEAEYMATTEAVKEAIWLKGLVGDLGLKQESSTVYCDNQSAIHLTKNQMFHERTKHIDVRFHFIWDVVSQGTVMVERIFIVENSADMMTKHIPEIKFKHCLDLIGNQTSESVQHIENPNEGPTRKDNNGVSLKHSTPSHHRAEGANVNVTFDMPQSGNGSCKNHSPTNTLKKGDLRHCLNDKLFKTMHTDLTREIHELKDVTLDVAKPSASTNRPHLDPSDVRLRLTSRSSYNHRYKFDADSSYTPEENTGDHVTGRVSCYR